MKNLLIAFVILFSHTAIGRGISELVPMFVVISDTTDTDVPAGKCLITGTVTKNGENINEALIYAESGIRVNSDKVGKFRMLVDTADTYLVIHKSPFQDAFMEGYKFKNKHHIEVKIYMPEAEIMYQVEKPVIYAYVEKTTAVQLKLFPTGKMAFTYPTTDQNNAWSFYAKPNGTIIHNEKEYPYLFWEATTDQLKYTTANHSIVGDVVKAEMVISFLEEKLTQIGLNETEKTDFITYWGPRITQNNYALIQFKIDETYDEIAKIEITPKPQNMRRVYLLFTPFDEFPTHLKIRASEQSITPLSRKGFTIVEWGGSQITEQQLYDQL